MATYTASYIWLRRTRNKGELICPTTCEKLRRRATPGDTAVDGLIAGILAGLAMAAYLVLAGLLSGVPLAETMGRFDPGQAGQWLAGTVAHLAVSGIYGVVFALLFAALLRLRPSLQRFGWLAGIVYGLFLFAFARGILFAALPSDMLQFTAVQLLVGHLIYGLLLGFEVSRR